MIVENTTFIVKYTPPPWAFKNKTIVPDGWGGMDEIPVNELSLEEKEDQDKKMKKKARQGDRQFVRKEQKQGEIVDYLGQNSGGYNYRVKYTLPS